jgi:hypothetical protein
LGKPDPKPTLTTFLLKGPLVVVGTALLFVVVYQMMIALALLVVVGAVWILMRLFGG